MYVDPNKPSAKTPVYRQKAAPTSKPAIEHPQGDTGIDAENVIYLETSKDSRTENETLTHISTRGTVSRLLQVGSEFTNGKSLCNQWNAALQRAKASGRHSALLVFRISEYHVLMETFGHTIGSELTCLVANRLKDCLRINDVLEQIADDEFMIVLDQMEHTEEVAMVAQRLISGCTGVYMLEGLRLHVHGAVGIALYPNDATELAELMRYAHIALVQADCRNSSSYYFFSTELLKQLREQAWMAVELEQAIEQERLVLHYQPQYEVGTKRIVGMEALVRLKTESGELIYPDRFIEIAEANGLIVPLGYWVIREACQQLKRWRDDGCRPLRMAVNVSPRQLVDEQLIEVISEAVEDCGLCYSDLELEITEQRMVEHLQSVEKVLRELSVKGIRIAIDDFGTGYSSLAYLARLPLKVMKIDRSFLADIEFEPRASRIVTAIIVMAKALDLEIIAEGVETPAQQRFLEAAGCHLGQGFGFARPQSAESIQPLL